MIKVSQLNNTPMGDALKELSEELNKIGFPSVSLNVIGEFVLMLDNKHPIVTHTDTDHIDLEMSDAFNKISDKIGEKYHLGNNWVNNDVFTAESDLKDYVFSTGNLHFSPAFAIGNIQINILDEPDLLRMKIIVIDTELTALGLNTQFTRFKDMKDIKTLIESSGKNRKEIFNETSKYIINSYTTDVIECYLDCGTDATKEAISLIAEINLKNAREKRMRTNTNNPNNPFIESQLSDLTDKQSDNQPIM